VPRVFVSIGSNIDRARNVRHALRALRERFGAIDSSSVYETAAVGFTGELFYNLVVAFDSDDRPEAIRGALRDIETAAGRQREAVPRFSARTLDLDLILYGDLVRHDDHIDVPAADIATRDFVLAPLAEMAPDAVHPEQQRTFGEMWRASGWNPPKKVELTTVTES